MFIVPQSDGEGKFPVPGRFRRRGGQEAVSLEVMVDGRGALQVPPKVLRDASARLTEPRLKSEAGALAALSACLPRGGARGGRYELAFPATR